jgi:hypothetical protein
MTTNFMPLLYKNPQPLNPEQHAALTLNLGTGFGFARETNSVPLVVEEFGATCRDYVIVFSTGEQAMPLVVLGVQPTHNAYVNAKGEWAADTYIPAYVRRYPFIFSENEGSEDLTLCVDVDAASVGKDEGVAFFNDKKEASDLTQQGLEFCKNFHIQLQQTREFCDALQAADLLVDQQASITLAEGETQNLSGFRIVDEQKFRQLPVETLQKFHERGWLGLIYAHLISTGSMGKLVAQLKNNPAA